MRPFVGQFDLTRLERVISGPGSADSLGDELSRYGCTRAVVVTGKTLGASALLQKVVRPLGDRCVGVFAHAQQHVPSRSVCDLVALIGERQGDCLISFGGGSPIDTAKAAVHSMLNAGGRAAAGASDALVHVAIPTTLSAGEFTAIAGVTDEASRIKRALTDPRLAPRTVVTDPTLTLETPDWLWAATGMRSIDHAIETIYSPRHHPLGDAAAARAISLLVEHLPNSLGDAADTLEHRAHCQIAAWLAVFGLPNAGLGLSHALGHQIGPRWGVPHGVTSCITLPHAMRFMAGRAAERFEAIAQALDVPFDAASPTAAAYVCAERVSSLVERLDLPRRLRDVGVRRQEIAAVAAVVHEAMVAAHPLGDAITRDEVRSLLDTAY